jgi:hypothetical protein
LKTGTNLLTFGAAAVDFYSAVKGRSEPEEDKWMAKKNEKEKEKKKSSVDWIGMAAYGARLYQALA